MLALLLLIPGASCALCLLLTPVARRLAATCLLVDRPDGRRKLHDAPIPVAGGVAILCSMVLTLALAWLVPGPLQDFFAPVRFNLLGLLLGALIICAVGVLDDFHRLRGRHKLLGQVIAAAVLMGFGVAVKTISFAGFEVDLGLLSVPFTLFLLLGAINSLNLLDGMDGLLSSVGLIISLAMAVMALLNDHGAAACVALALAGALLGFLRYNFPPASIFLGDSGSMLIGLVIGALAIQCSLKGPATVALAAPAALLAVPIFDTTAAILRRKLTGRSLYTTDRAHIHHCLLRRGLPRQRVLLLVSLFCLVTCAGALASLAFKNELLAVLSALAVVAILISTRLFGYAELSLVRQRLQAALISSLRRPQPGTGWEMEVRLQGSMNWNELWLTIIGWSESLSLKTIRLDVNAPALAEGYHAYWERPHGETEEDGVWRAEIPVVAHGRAIGRLEVVGYQDAQPASEKIARLAELMQTFEERASSLTRASGITPPLRPPAVAPVRGEGEARAAHHPGNGRAPVGQAKGGDNGKPHGPKGTVGGKQG